MMVRELSELHSLTYIIQSLSGSVLHETDVAGWFYYSEILSRLKNTALSAALTVCCKVLLSCRAALLC